MKELNHLLTDNWYYAVLFTNPYSGSYDVICFARNPKEAENKVKNYFLKFGIGGALDMKKVDKVCLYHKNYKREAREMVLTGKYTD